LYLIRDISALKERYHRNCREKWNYCPDIYYFQERKQTAANLGQEIHQFLLYKRALLDREASDNQESHLLRGLYEYSRHPRYIFLCLNCFSQLPLHVIWLERQVLPVQSDVFQHNSCSKHIYQINKASGCSAIFEGN
jgi:hypothetical protein